VPAGIPFHNPVHIRGEVECGYAGDRVNNVNALSDALAADAGQCAPSELELAAP